MQPQPSELFLTGIQRAYNRACRFNARVTCGDLWSQVISECTVVWGGLAKMFEWDDPHRPNDHRNRVKLIADCIIQGLVPGLALTKDARGRETVVRSAAAETVPGDRP
jgi:hypothetical protein